MDIKAFINSSSNDDVDNTESRKSLVDSFINVHRHVNCAHGFADSLIMADYILRNRHFSGNLFEFGCFEGGMSAKLSIVASLINKKYCIYDTFTGLPQAAVYEAYDAKKAELGIFKAGMFASTFENTKKNIENYGKIESCDFFPGLVENTLNSFNEEVMFAFIDVDIVETASFIVEKTWNHVTSHGIFTHEACLKTYMQSFLNTNWWNIKFKQSPPICYSGKLSPGKKQHGFDDAGCLDFIMKTDGY